MQINERKIVEVVIGILWVSFSVFLVQKVLIGGFFNMLWLVGVIILTVYFFLLNQEKQWHGYALGLLPGTVFTLNVYGMGAVNASFLFTIFVILLMLSEVILKKRGDNLLGPRRFEDVVMGLILGYGIIRLLYDRPGLVAFGAGEGGLMTALFFVVGAGGFFAYKALCYRVPVSVKNFGMIIFFGIMIGIQVGFRSVRMGKRLWFQELSGHASWMLTAILLVMCLGKNNKLGSRFWVISFFFLLLGIVADHRLNFFLVGLVIMAVAFFYKKAGRAFVIMGIAGIIGVSVLISSGKIPDYIRRPLSLVMPSVANLESGGSEDYVARNMGFEDRFRGTLYKMAWKEIKQNPFQGKGFGLNVQEALIVLGGGNDDDQLSMLALGGAYHNTFVMMATKLGLPLAVMFLLICLLVPIRLGMAVYRHEDSVMRRFSVILLVFWAALFSLSFVNGGKHEFFMLAVVLGYMSALYTKIIEEKSNGGVVAYE